MSKIQTPGGEACPKGRVGQFPEVPGIACVREQLDFGQQGVQGPDRDGDHKAKSDPQPEGRYIIAGGHQ